MYGLKKLTSVNSVSGDEGQIRNVIKELVTPYADSVTIDSMGNLIAYKKGTNPGGKKILFCAHMDEVGYIVSSVTEDGYLKFKCVGGIDDRIMLAQRVLVGKNAIPGVIGIKAVHLQTAEERKNVIKQKDMYIDIGAKTKEEALEKVSLGDYVAFDSDYRDAGNRIKAKALDDRVGCALMCQLIKGQYRSDLYFCFTVQEEVGCRGSVTVARRLCADVAVVLEGTTAADTPSSEEHVYSTVLGQGPAISLVDKGSHSDRELNAFITDIAKAKGIDYQFKKTAFGGNDARSFQTKALPCKVTAISLPCRYIHSPVSMADKGDLENMLLLCREICSAIHGF